MEIIPEIAPVVWLTMPFVFVYFALQFILFRPFYDFLQERDGISAKALAEAEEMHQAAGDKLQLLNQKLAEARKDAGELRNAARGRAHVEETEILGAARAAADEKVDDAVAKIADEKRVAATTLRGTAKVLSGQIADQILSA